ncbi:MAG TPA: FAD-linked oxidase C-terminal domain-containing protein [Ardenticatenaceae bacterium]|nr:FAD-linked oxidase C-terminal domain-containing protein [Ardenticatenaceae bacterium]
MDRERLRRELEELLGPGGVLHRPEDVLLYEYDGSLDRARPDFVVFPRTTAQVAGIVRLANHHRIPFMPRGAGTGLSGGVVPVEGGIVVAFTRMREILAIDLANRLAVVQPGVVNIEISEAVAAEGFYFVPDPSSQRSCTIGGNVAENSGGPHCLAYGVTANHVLGLEIVTPEGDTVEVGAMTADVPGYDLTGLVVGSEGTLGLVTKVIVRLEYRPEAVKTLLAVFDSIGAASEAVSAIIASGTIPAALEMMDNLAIRAIKAAKQCGYPTDADAVLLIDVEGLRDGLEETAAAVANHCWATGAREVREARTELEREKLWSGRKGAFGAMGRISRSYYVQDGVIPRTRLPDVLRRVADISHEFGFRIANVFHAGDGNLHPLILFDETDPEQVRGVVRAGTEILKACVEAGGSISGEHGIGLEKRDDMVYLFAPADLVVQRMVRDALNPDGRCNPGKVLPIAKACYEVGRRHRRLPAALIEEHRLAPE